MNRRCDVCGIEFDAKSHNALRCSASCNKAAKRKREQSPERKEAERKREQLPERKAAKRKRQQSPECKAVRRTYDENTRAAAQFFQALGMVEAMAGTK